MASAQIVVAVSCALVAVLACLSKTFLSVLLLCILFVSVILCGVECVIWLHIRLSSTYRTGRMIRPVLMEYEGFRNKLRIDMVEHNKGETHLPVILGRTLDILMQQIIDLTLRDYVSYYLQNIVFQPKKQCDVLKHDIWTAIAALHERLVRIDQSKFIACDVVTKITGHFERIRETIATKPDNLTFKISPHLISREAELEYLKQVSELFIMFLMPRSYSLSPAKYFYRDIFTVKVLFSTIDKITDPDYINQTIKTYIESTNMTATFLSKRPFHCINTFEDVIQKTDDIEFITNKRMELVKKIMEATTLLNIKRGKGIDVDADRPTAGISKSELAMIKKLKKLVEQLSLAKRECERRLVELGVDVGPQCQLLPLNVILDHVIGRKCLSLFLDELASSGLIGFWLAVEELKTVSRKFWHQIGAEIYYTYIKTPTIEIKVDQTTKKRIEAFLLGDKGPEVFYEMQQKVVLLLEAKYYNQFINSVFYQNMIEAMEKSETTNVTEIDRTVLSERQESIANIDSAGNLYIGDHSNYSKRKLHELEEKLQNKQQALQAMRTSLKPDSRVLTYLEKEVTVLQGERRQLEAHLTRTEVWGENLGKWRAVVQSAEVAEDRESLVLIVIVEMDETGECGELAENISTGWVVSRTLAQFHELHRKLRPLFSSNARNTVELPSQSVFKFLFGKPESSTLDKAKQQVQKYLEFILKDDRLNQSEAIYAFLSPSADHLKETSISPKKSKFSITTIFKSANSTDSTAKDGNTGLVTFLKDHSEDSIDLSKYLDTPDNDSIDSVATNTVTTVSSATGMITTGTNATVTTTATGVNARIVEDSKDSKDSIGDPLYALFSEIFEVQRGLFKYVRKALIAFVQATYNRTISRQIHDTIAYYFSEMMIQYYFTLALKTFWPGGELYKPERERTLSEKRQTAAEAKRVFLETVPDFFKQIVGSNVAKNGVLKIFETLQVKQMNKQLFYEVFELFLCEVFPEIGSKDFGDDSAANADTHKC